MPRPNGRGFVMCGVRTVDPDEDLGRALLATEPGYMTTAYALIVCAEQPDGTIAYHLRTPQGQAPHVTLRLIHIGAELVDDEQ